MFRVVVNKSQLDNIEQLAAMLNTAPAKIQRANDRAGASAKKRIEQNLKRRGRPGRLVKVAYKKYGPLGLKFSFTTRGSRGGSYGGNSTKTNGYSALWASRVFLNAEQGMTGRRAFTLPKKQQGIYTSKSGRQTRYTKRYRVSHSSGEWKEGQKLLGPLRIPAIGPFYFSAKSNMPRETIQDAARNILRTELNKEYKKEFGKMLRKK